MKYILQGADIFDGSEIFSGSLLIDGERIAAILPPGQDVPDARVERLGGGLLAPGFVDLQVNGGGGVMLGDAPHSDTLERIADTHAHLGATTILPTLITDRPETTEAAIGAVEEALARGTRGIAGLHLEGPHLSIARKGAHAARLIRPMTQPDLDLLCDAAQKLPCLVVTVAPESVSTDQIAALARSGAIVALGHSDADAATCRAAIDAGATLVTHLFNAMSQIAAREPGLVGAALGHGAVDAGLIADGIHVHPENVALALRAKRGPGEIFVVSDSMAVAGTAMSSFTLDGREIRRADRRLTLSDGTLAGADVDLSRALRVLRDMAQVPLARALAMVTSIPARVIGAEETCGVLRAGGWADVVHLSDALFLNAVWERGVRLTPLPT